MSRSFPPWKHLLTCRNSSAIYVSSHTASVLSERTSHRQGSLPCCTLVNSVNLCTKAFLLSLLNCGLAFPGTSWGPLSLHPALPGWQRDPSPAEGARSSPRLRLFRHRSAPAVVWPPVRPPALRVRSSKKRRLSLTWTL